MSQNSAAMNDADKNALVEHLVSDLRGLNFEDAVTVIARWLVQHEPSLTTKVGKAFQAEMDAKDAEIAELRERIEELESAAEPRCGFCEQPLTLTHDDCCTICGARQ